MARTDTPKARATLALGAVLLCLHACKSGGAPTQLPRAAAGAGANTRTDGGAAATAPTAGAPASMPVAGAMPNAGAGAVATQPTSGTGGAADKPATIPDAGVQPNDAQTPPMQACPSSTTLKAGDSQLMLEHGGRSRSYRVHVPSSIKPMLPVPLVLDFHGNGSSGSQEAGSSGWARKADTEGFITVYPDGVGNAWNVGNCCGEALSSNIDDVGFAKAIVASISKATCIDAKRVYATGISNGAGLAHRLACEAADVFAAIAAASADLVTDPCKPARPISELSIRGLSDVLVAYEGGNTGSTGWYSPGAKGTLTLWKTIDQCAGTVDTSRQYCETYAPCAQGVEITLCSLPDTGHVLYDNALSFSVPDIAWDMFKRQPMP